MFRIYDGGSDYCFYAQIDDLPAENFVTISERCDNPIVYQSMQKIIVNKQLRVTLTTPLDRLQLFQGEEDLMLFNVHIDIKNTGNKIVTFELGNIHTMHNAGVKIAECGVVVARPFVQFHSYVLINNDNWIMGKAIRDVTSTGFNFVEYGLFN